MKKVKCSECKCMSRWCLPEIVNDHNYNYAISAYNAAQRSFVCLQTAKTKALSNKQYCKYFEEKNEKPIIHLKFKGKTLTKCIKRKWNN